MSSSVDDLPSCAPSVQDHSPRARLPRKVLEDAPDLCHLLERLCDDDPFLRSSIDALSPSVRTRHVFDRAGIACVGDLRAYDDARLLRFSGFGLKSLSEVKQALLDHLGPPTLSRAPAGDPVNGQGLRLSREIVRLEIFVASQALAKTISDALIQARLAASTHVRSVHSQYRRPDGIETVEEWVLEIRSVSWLSESIVRTVRRLHPGGDPVVMALPCAFLSEGSTEWVISECVTPDPLLQGTPPDAAPVEGS